MNYQAVLQPIPDNTNRGSGVSHVGSDGVIVPVIMAGIINVFGAAAVQNYAAAPIQIRNAANTLLAGTTDISLAQRQAMQLYFQKIQIAVDTHTVEDAINALP